MLAALMLCVSSSALAVPAFKVGMVVTRSLILGPNGLPILAEFDAEGNVVDIIGETTGPLEGAWVISGDAYRQYLAAYDTFMAQNATTSAQGAYILLRPEYEATTFTTATGAAVTKPALFSSTLSVLVRHQTKILAPSVSPVLLESPIDLRNRVTLAADTRAVLLNKKGQVLRQAKVNIGYRVAFFSGDGYEDDASDDQRIIRRADDIAWGPVPFAGIEVTIDPRARSVSGNDGKYSISYQIPGCPGFTYEYEHNVIGEVYYKSFNPKSVRPFGSYYTALTVYDFCSELSAGLANDGTLLGQLTRIDIIGIEATSAIPLVRADLRIDVNMITGNGALLGRDGFVPLGEVTTYESVPPMALPPALDPEQLRAPRAEADLDHKGLLAEISPEDLEDTDIYVFRMSNDQLVTQRTGLKQGEYVPYNGQGTSENTFYYKMLIRGTRMNDFLTGKLEAYQEKTQVNPELVGNRVDFLRAGERIKVIAINRATGYIGTSVGTVGTGVPGTIDFPIPPLLLRPPNLKVKVERLFHVVGGLTDGEERRNLIGFEGAGLTSDMVIAITTEWTDHDGSPLPSELDGYTGRLAKVVAPNELGAVGGVAQFAVKPGTHLQLVQLPEETISNEHFYLHLSGQPEDRNPDFSTLGAGEGALQMRPAHYVPFRVPVFVEDASRYIAELEAAILKAGWTEGEPAPVLGPLERVYAWPYRPEMQFSLYDLKLTDISSETEFGDDGLVNDTTITYDLAASIEDPLDPLGARGNLVWALGYEEEAATIDAGQSTTFSQAANVYAALGGLTPADYLTLQLYTTTDTGNSLFEFAGVPLVNMWPRRITLERSYTQGTWDASLAAAEDADVAESVQMLDFYLTDEADVEVALLDANQEERGIIVPEKTLMRGRRFFLITYDQVTALGIKPSKEIDFYLEVRGSTAALATEGPTRSHTVRIAGRIREVHEGVILGQLFQHGVMIQDGSLTLQRTDFSYGGRGQPLSFSRSYSNRDPRKNGLMGQGWNHNLDVSLMPMRWDADVAVPGGHPKWVQEQKNKFFARVDLPAPDDDPELIRVAVSTGGQFKKVGGLWYAQRGQHGRLVETADGFDYYAKDGTRFHFDKPERLAVDEDLGEDEQTPRWTDVEDYGAMALGVEPYLLKLKEEDADLAGQSSAGAAPVRFIADRNGNQTSFEYRWLLDESGEAHPHPTKVTDSSGRVVFLDYAMLSEGAVDEDGEPIIYEVRQEPGTTQQLPAGVGWRLVAVRTSGDVGVTVNLEYDDQGQLRAVRRDTLSERYAYAPQEEAPGYFNLASFEDAAGRITSYGYMGVSEVPAGLTTFVVGLKRGDVIKTVTYPDGAVIAFGYDFGSGNVRTVKDALNNTTRYVLNAYGNPLRIEEPLGKTTQMTWSVDVGQPDNVMVSSIDPMGRTRTLEYDARGNVTKETDAFGTITRSWDQTFSRPLTVTNRLGHTVTNTYDSRGNLLTETNELGKTITHTYAANGDLLSSTDRNGNTTTFTYNTYGFLQSQTAPTDAGPAVTAFDTDARGRTRFITSPRGHTQTFTYDALDRMIEETDLEGYRNAAQYDAVGNKVREITKRGLVFDHTYDARNRLKTTRRSIDGAVKTRTYDANGNLLTETDWKGQVTSYTYDALNRVVGTTQRDGSTTAITYDLAGNIVSGTDAVGRVRTYTYDAADRLLTSTVPNGGTTTTTYDAEGRALTVTDPLGSITTKVYDAASRPISETDALGNAETYTYDDNGNMILRVDREGRQWRYEYDAGNRTTRTIDPMNGVTERFYDKSGNCTRVVDREGRETNTTYDGLNRPVSSTDPMGGVSTFEYDPEGAIVASVDAEGRERTTTFDLLGRGTISLDAVGAATRTEYDANGNAVRIVDAVGAVTVSTFDAMDRALTTTVGHGTLLAQTTTRTYDAAGRILTETAPDGATTTYVYNGIDKITSRTDAGGNVWATTYNLRGQTLVATNAEGRRTAYTYDALGRMRTLARNASGSDPVGITSKFTYDKVGSLVTVEEGVTQASPSGRVSQHTYDALGRITESRVAGALLFTRTYDKQGNVLTTTDALGRVTSTEYDDLDRPTKVTFPDMTSVSYTYDKVGNLLTTNDEVGVVSSATYDGENRVLTQTSGAGETTTFTYDKRGTLLKTKRPLGNSASFEVDVLGRVTSAKDSASQTTVVYDKGNRVVRQIDPMNNPTEFEYDVLGRRTVVRQKGATGDLENRFTFTPNGYIATWRDSLGKVISFTQDGHGRERTRTYPVETTVYRSPRVITHTYDALDRITKVKETKYDVTAPPGEELGDKSTNITYDAMGRTLTRQTRDVLVTYTYDAVGNRVSMVDLNEVDSSTNTTLYTYDARDRLLTVTRNGQLTVTYDYRDDGLVERALFADFETLYSYDGAKRLTKLTNKTIGSPGTTISEFEYLYDANGNVKTKRDTQTGMPYEVTSYTYDTADRLIRLDVTADGSQVLSVTYTLDANGNRIAESTTVGGTTTSRLYTYDQLNRLRTLSEPSGTVTFTYDDSGNLISKLDTRGGTTSTLYDYDVRDQLVQTRIGAPGAEVVMGTYDYDYRGLRIKHRNSGRGTVNYHYDDDRVFREEGIADYTYGAGLVRMDTPQPATFFYARDGLGSVSNLVESGGAIDVSYRDDTWGETRQVTGDTTSVNRFRFTGKALDDRTGLIYFGARYYDPDLGRFITQDSVLGTPTLPISLNRYVYANANPTIYVDPDGHFPVLKDLADGAGKFNQWLGDRAKLFDKGPVGAVAGAAVGVSKFVVGAAEGVLRIANYGANLAAVPIAKAVGATKFEDQIRTELADTHTALVDTVDYIVNKGGGADIYEAAVGRATDAMEGDPRAITGTVELILNIATLKVGANGLSRGGDDAARLTAEATTPTRTSAATSRATRDPDVNPLESIERMSEKEVARLTPEQLEGYNKLRERQMQRWNDDPAMVHDQALLDNANYDAYRARLDRDVAFQEGGRWAEWNKALDEVAAGKGQHAYAEIAAGELVAQQMRKQRGPTCNFASVCNLVQADMKAGNLKPQDILKAFRKHDPAYGGASARVNFGHTKMILDELGGMTGRKTVEIPIENYFEHLQKVKMPIHTGLDLGAGSHAVVVSEMIKLKSGQTLYKVLDSNWSSDLRVNVPQVHRNKFFQIYTHDELLGMLNRNGVSLSEKIPPGTK